MPLLSRLQSAAARRAPVFVLVTTLLCALTLAAGYANKARCIGPTYDDRGRTTPDYGVRITRDVCYTDIQYLWLGRDIDRQVFPYVNGGYDATRGELYGGAVEYPVGFGRGDIDCGAGQLDGGDIHPGPVQECAKIPQALRIAENLGATVPSHPAHRSVGFDHARW